MIDYYDAVLGFIPVSVVGVSGALFGFGIDLSVAVTLGALLAAGAIGHAMFVRAPVGTERTTPSTESTQMGRSDSGPETYNTAD